MFFLTGKQSYSNMSSYWTEGKIARMISYSCTTIFTDYLYVRINGSDQCRRTTRDTFGFAVSFHYNNSFKAANCCSCIGVSELFTNETVCDQIIVGGTMNND